MVFGASGALGSAVVASLTRRDWAVVPATRAPSEQAGWTSTAEPGWSARVPVLNGAVWAGGMNSSDTVTSGVAPFRELFDANVGYVIETLSELLAADRFAAISSLVVLSSVWQQVARRDKASYTVSKAAVGGLVRSAAADLGARGIRVNAVLPGVVQTPMTSAFLSTRQIEDVAEDTPLGRLVSSEEVAATVSWLLSEESSGITGTSIVVDGGWSATHAI